MNANQRKFLTESIEKQYRRERDALKNKRPTEPNLNNYLTAAILDRTFQLKPAEEIIATIHQRVVTLGQGKTLLSSHQDSWRSRDDDEDKQQMLSIPADVLFVFPPGYMTAKEEYDRQKAEWDAQMEALDNSFEAMKIKVQLGSDKALAALIDQADQLCSMSLTASSKLMLTGPKE